MGWWGGMLPSSEIPSLSHPCVLKPSTPRAFPPLVSPPQPRGRQRHHGGLGFFGGKRPRSSPARCCHHRRLSSASSSPHTSTPSCPNTFPFALVSGISLCIGLFGSSVHLILFRILFISLSLDSVKARQWNFDFSCLRLMGPMSLFSSEEE